jgi:hypothetical protein
MSSNQFESFTFLLPKTYREEKLLAAELQVRDSDNGLVRVPLAVEETEVGDWKNKLVAFVHTRSSTKALVVEARYGFPCTWVLTGEAGR